MIVIDHRDGDARNNSLANLTLRWWTPLTEAPRPYPVALAEQLSKCRPKDPRLDLLNRLFRDMTPADQLRVRATLHAIRAARREAAS